MNDRRVTVIAFLVGVLGTAIFVGGRRAEIWVRGTELPAWAVYGTAGSSTVAYLYAIKIAVLLLIVTAALGAGYYVGRRADVIREYRRLIRSLGAGVVAGVFGTCLVALQSVFLSLGDIPSVVSQPQASEMFVMDIVLPLLVLFTVLSEVGVLGVVGMLAGAMLAQARSEMDTAITPSEDATAPSH